MAKTNLNYLARKRRHARVRKNVNGTLNQPRLNVFRSLNHIYAQVIDDTKGVTLASASSLDTSIKVLAEKPSKTEQAKIVGKLVAERALEVGVTKVVFDRGGYKYHGRIKALADSSRENGLKF
ncbi:50S ribosomal protein L18 [Anaerolineales bacterium HSG6]|nr:50S ribosomal protein L18 [Anaerolineales bacterium HSG6]MDM8530072.1 50S ribosomal protein L18 [Anaerolineales bacterium HSG25]